MGKCLGHEQGANRDTTVLDSLDIEDKRDEGDPVSDRGDTSAQPEPSELAITKEDLSRGRGYATASSATSSALSMMANPSASSLSLMHKGGFVMIVFQRTNV